MFTFYIKHPSRTEYKQCLETIFECLQQQVSCQPRRQDPCQNLFLQKRDLILDGQVSAEVLQHVLLDEVPHPHLLLPAPLGQQLAAAEHELAELGHFIPHLRDALAGFGGDAHDLGGSGNGQSQVTCWP